MTEAINQQLKYSIMKRTLILLAVIAGILPVAGQDYEYDREINTIFGDGRISHGGYGAISIAYSQINGKDALVMGGRGSWVIGHAFAFGIGGTGFINDYEYNRTLDLNANLAGGSGGLVLEPIIIGTWPVHISLPILIGAGGVAYAASYDPYAWVDPNYFVEDAVPFAVVEPGAELEFNVVKFFRISLGAYYRYTSDIQLLYTTTDVLNGFSYGVCFKFGKF
jgi:hypothetical protein